MWARPASCISLARDISRSALSFSQVSHKACGCGCIEGDHLAEGMFVPLFLVHEIHARHTVGKNVYDSHRDELPVKSIQLVI